MKKKVFISSPYTIGDQALNVRTQIRIANELMNEGYIPYTPLLSHFQHMIYPRPYEDWMELDFAWIELCDCVLRLEGESKGADREVAFAISKGIPVYYSIEQINNVYKY